MEGKSCDDDGFVDAGERGTIVVPVMNGGPVALIGTTVTVATSTPGISYKHGRSARISRIAPFSSREVEIEFEIDRAVTGIGQLQFEVTVSNEESCDTTISHTVTTLINVDDLPNSSRTDTVESPSSPWTPGGGDASQIWSRVEVEPFSHAWLGIDFGTISDTTLTSPELQVGNAPLVIAFDHRHSFETDGGVAPFFDGGMIEISRNGGPFVDISTFVNPGYGGALFDGSGNPLAGRQAFVGRNAAFPARNHVTLNLGTTFAGETVRIRFRIGTDAAVGDLGWELDNLEFQGITNVPFPTMVADMSKCRGVPKK